MQAGHRGAFRASHRLGKGEGCLLVTTAPVVGSSRAWGCGCSASSWHRVLCYPAVAVRGVLWILSAGVVVEVKGSRVRVDTSELPGGPLCGIGFSGHGPGVLGAEWWSESPIKDGFFFLIWTEPLSMGVSWSFGFAGQSSESAEVSGPAGCVTVAGALNQETGR
ncbi:hypothetical protein NDU88_002859 [Pleurodeles waltl]|uniref:Uncharacterized protein n=1 Tax=Pleurodeles waltl TaxID=8319 RepID=A0AAV7PCZ4_PLEWA|nr:hypothetical protein NDU88_002859 [Pleurodeles waltl]